MLCYFHKLYLSQAYQQFALDRESKKYVVISTYKGLFLCTHLPYGVSSAPGIFQRAMEMLLRSSENLERVGLRAKRHKCIFRAPSLSYLVYVIDAQGLHPQPDKIEAIEDAPKPKNVTELKSYLGLYCPILGNSYLAPLYKLLGHDTKWEWKTAQDKAFENSNKILTSSNLLIHLDLSKNYSQLEKEGLSYIFGIKSFYAYFLDTLLN